MTVPNPPTETSPLARRGSAAFDTSAALSNAVETGGVRQRSTTRRQS
jgi:hypothetical protein